jgi:superfamily II DNA or RNA helicase
MKITITNHLHIVSPPQALLQKIRDTFTIENPEWLENHKMRRWQGRTHRWLTFFKKHMDGLSIPRGAMGLILFFCKELGIRYQIIDQRRTMPPVEFTFTGLLKGYQEQAVSDIRTRDFGVLEAPTGSGKTVIALSIIAARRQPCLVIVHSKELLNQWIERVEQFLNISRSEIGVVGDGKKKVGELITVGIVNSVYQYADSISPHIGFLIVDECHRTPSRTFTEAVTAFDCNYMLGLSATPYRRDGLTKLIGWHLGRKIAVKQADLTEADIIKNVEVIIRETDFVTEHDGTEEYSQMLSELTEDEERNNLIVEDVIAEASSCSGICLVLTDRKEHCNALAALISPSGIETAVLTGEVSNGERSAIVECLNAGKVKVLIATGQLIGEGFDCRGLSTLFLATPIKFSGRLIQYLGRIMRPAPGKERARVFDYVDVGVDVLLSSASARGRIYDSL